jgi:hypothetical protein
MWGGESSQAVLNLKKQSSAADEMLIKIYLNQSIMLVNDNKNGSYFKRTRTSIHYVTVSYVIAGQTVGKDNHAYSWQTNVSLVDELTN